MLFRSEFHDGLRDGAIRSTYRIWKTAKVRVGREYRFAVGDALRVDAISTCHWSDLDVADAHRAGFEDLDRLRAELERTSKAKLTPRSSLFRVDFTYVVAQAPAASRQPDEPSLEEAVQKVVRIDGRARGGPWAYRALRWIGENPRVAARHLAAQLDQETRPVKARVRRLKALGLLTSHEVGYELTPLGKATVEVVEESG